MGSRRIVLVGARGSGKSSVGRALAALLHCGCADSDDEVERRAGCSIRTIFESEGEAGFRARERAVIAELLGGASGPVAARVVSAGGGAVLAEENRRLMRAAGVCVWLTAPVDALVARVRGDTTSAERRPTLSGMDPRSEMEAVVSSRAPLYREVADHVIDTAGQSPQDIARRIVALVRD